MGEAGFKRIITVTATERKISVIVTGPVEEETQI